MKKKAFITLNITYDISQNDKDLQDIIALQKANLPASITKDELKQQGFVTIVHDINLLRAMHKSYGHTVARVDGHVVGYTLSMERHFADDIPYLIPMFKEIDSATFHGQQLATSKYIVMGQVCIAKDFRGIGIFDGLYGHMAQIMSSNFDFIITEIALTNPRSIRAHIRVGFEEFRRYKTSDGQVWTIVGYALSNT